MWVEKIVEMLLAVMVLVAVTACFASSHENQMSGEKSQAVAS